MMMMMLIRLNLCLLFFFFPATTQATFNLEVERRVIDRLTDYLGNPLDAAALTSNFRRNGGFRYGMEGRDRDDYLKFAYSLTQNTVYFGLEDGTCLGYYVNVVFYREPGFAGYLPEENPEHYASCVDATTGEQKNCQMQKGASYVRCVNNCALELCPNATDIWCKQYEIAQMGSEEPLGFLPLTYSCHDELGKLTQEPGKAFRREGGNCMFRDGKTLVNRTLAGTYHYCQAKDVCDAAVTTEPQVCDDTFVGGFRSDDYDPRYRPWYTLTKEFQAPNWAAPYPFFDNLDIGVTFSHPIYDYEGDKKIFAGVLAIDYTFGQIEEFLQNSYQNSTTAVVIYEDEAPHFVIGSSTNGRAAKKVLIDETGTMTPCPDVENRELACTTARVPMEEFSTSGGDTIDYVLVEAFLQQKMAGYPRNDAVIVRDRDGVHAPVYQSQASLYEQSGANLKWRVLVVSPTTRSDKEAITKGDVLFGVTCIIACLGMTICFIMFLVFFGKRSEKVMMYADWRFTCLFLSGCTLMNATSFSLLGKNTDVTCLLRMWAFHFVFVLTLAPLFAKTWRMARISQGAATFRRTVVTHKQAATYMLPPIIAQSTILLIFTFVDPCKPTENIDIDGLSVTQRIDCGHDSIAFFVTQLMFEVGLIGVGCVLSYKTRNLDDNFGESKQLFFAMYNIAFIGLITVLILTLMDVDGEGKKFLQAISVFWGTVFSSAAFVLPRVMQVGQGAEKVRGTENSSDRGVAGSSHRMRLPNLENGEDASGEQKVPF